MDKAKTSENKRPESKRPESSCNENVVVRRKSQVGHSQIPQNRIFRTRITRAGRFPRICVKVAKLPIFKTFLWSLNIATLHQYVSQMRKWFALARIKIYAMLEQNRGGDLIFFPGRDRQARL
jgi:hypothetical protein